MLVKTRLSLFAIIVFCFFGLWACSDSEDAGLSSVVNQKLETQFELYKQAQTKIIDRVVTEKGKVERTEWEQWLTPADDSKLTEEELAELREYHQADIESSRDAAIADSKLDLSTIRSDETKITEYCADLPKGALLHIHPSGTRNAQTIKDMLEEIDPTINGKELLKEANNGTSTVLYKDEIDFLTNLPLKKYSEQTDEIKAKIEALFILPMDPISHDFKRFEALFSINDTLKEDETKIDWLEEKTYLDFLKRAASQKVMYVEFTKVMYPDTKMFEKLHTWATKFHDETGIVVRWNSAFIRTLDYETNTEWTNSFISILESNTYEELIGIDLLANETDTPALETGQNIYVPILNANNEGKISINRTMHAGELGDIRNVRDAMIMGSERVGHGVLLWQDPVSLEFARRIVNLPIEINLYSNLRLKVQEDLSKHPFIKFLRLGLPVSLSTDDEGMFVTDINKECTIAVSKTDITHSEMKRMSYNSLETAFADKNLKSELIKKLDAAFTEFENKWSEKLKN